MVVLVVQRLVLPSGGIFAPGAAGPGGAAAGLAAGVAAGAIFAPAAASDALALLPGCGSFAFSFFGAIAMTVVAQRVSCLKVCMCVCE